MSPTRNEDYSGTISAWNRIRLDFLSRGVNLPFDFYGEWRFQSMINATLSAKNGQPIGWRYKSLIEVSHYLETKYKNGLIIFGYALDAYGHREKWLSGDRSGKWKNKQVTIREKIGRCDPDYLPDEEWIGVIGFLFPEIRDRVERYMERAKAFYALADAEIADL